ncbi:hypothetical protein GF312_10380 [Candidatus Poribacteria bacterium]|nr:hypothetical protein [Candidatus Poribacteria bacterium]
MVDRTMQIREWLGKIGMEKYAKSFEENRVTFENIELLTKWEIRSRLGVFNRKDRYKIYDAIQEIDDIYVPKTLEDRKRLKKLGFLGQRKFEKLHKDAPEGEPKYPSGSMWVSVIMFLIPPLFISGFIIFSRNKKRDIEYFTNTGKRYRKSGIYWIASGFWYFWWIVISLAFLGGMIALAFIL